MDQQMVAEFLKNPLRHILQIGKGDAVFDLIEAIKAWVVEQIKVTDNIAKLRATLISASENTSFHQDLQLMFSELLSWTTPGTFDKQIFYSVLATTERSKFALFQYLESRYSSANPFFISAFQPKSGGTFLSTLLRDEYRYRSEIFYAYGSADTNYMIPARVEVLKAVGGEFNHLHLGANSWNQHVLKKCEVPFWVHLRDPRDSFFSALSMMLREHERDNEDSLQYLDELRHTYGTDICNPDINVRARLYLDMLDSYCAWSKNWLEFDYQKKFVTYHRELTDIPLLRRKINQFFAMEDSQVSSTHGQSKLSYAEHRFNGGINGLWRRSLDPDIVDAIQIAYRKYFDDDLTW